LLILKSIAAWRWEELELVRGEEEDGNGSWDTILLKDRIEEHANLYIVFMR